MAIERKADTSTKIAVAAEPKKAAAKSTAAPASRSAANSQGKQPRRQATAPVGSGIASPKVAQLRADLSAARRDLALNKLDSPAKIRQLRKDLARTLTAERAKTATKEAA